MIGLLFQIFKWPPVSPIIIYRNQSISDNNQMEVNYVVKNLIGLASSKAQTQSNSSKISLQSKNMSTG